VSLLPPDGHTTLLKSLEYEIDLSVHERTRMRTRIAGLPIVGAGRYIFHLEYRNEGETDWKDAAKVPLVVKVEAHSSSAS